MSDETPNSDNSSDVVAEWDTSSDGSSAATRKDPEEKDSDEQKRLERHRRRVKKRRQSRRRRRNKNYNDAVNSVPGRSPNSAHTPTSSKLTGESIDDESLPEQTNHKLQNWAYENKIAFTLLVLGAGAVAIFLILFV